MERRSNSTSDEEKRKCEGRGLQRSDVNADVIQGVRGSIEREVEGRNRRKGNHPTNQTWFRKGMGTMDNVLNYLVNKRLKAKKVIAMFVDLKAAFDSVDREVLLYTMR